MYARHLEVPLDLAPIADRHIETCGWLWGNPCGRLADDIVHVVNVDRMSSLGHHAYEPACRECALEWPCDAHELLLEVIRLRTVTV